MAASCPDFSNRLSTTIYFLLDQETCPVDELLLQKLLTHVAILSTNKNDLLLNIDVKRLVKSLSVPRKDARLLSFGFGLFGILGSIENNVKEELIGLLVKNWLKRIKNPNCPAIIRSSGLQMLTKLITDSTVKEIIADLGVDDVVIDLLQDSSIFVCYEAQIFLNEFLTRSEKIGEKNLKRILQKFQEDFQCCLNLFKKIFGNENISVKFKREIEGELLKFVLSCEDKFVAGKNCDVLILTSLKNHEKAVSDVLKYLTTSNFVDVAVKFCCDVLSRCESMTVKQKLQNFVLEAIEVCRTSENKNDKTFLSTTNIVLRLDFAKMDDDFNTKSLTYFCDLLQTSFNQPPKLVISLLQALYTISSVLITNPKLQSRAVTSITQIIKSRSSPNSITIKSLDILSRMVDNFPIDIGADLILHDIVDSLSHLLYHPSWEIQDSVLEFIAKSVKVTESSDELQHLFLTNRLHASVLEKVFSADESFVRASAVMALLALSQIRLFWEKLVEVHSEEKIVKRILSLMTDDTEAVVRRSATRVINDWYRNEFIGPNWKRQFHLNMYKASNDLDWEVKLIALEFWEGLFHVIEDEYALNNLSIDVEKFNSAIDRLDKVGFCKSLISSISDYDSSVKLKSATILKIIQRKIIDSHHRFPIKEKSKTKIFNTEKMDVDDDEADYLIPINDNIMEEVLNTRDCDAVTHTSRDTLKMADSDVRICEIEHVEMGTSEFISSLMNFDLDSIITDAEMNSDIYEDNLELLIDDIASKWKNINVIQDCY